MKNALKIKFFKPYLINKLIQAVNSPHKDSFVECFIKETHNWIYYKLAIINSILPSYQNVEVYDFITKEEIIQIIAGKNYQDKVEINNLIARLKNLIQELARTSIGKSDLVATYDETTGTINITYAQ